MAFTELDPSEYTERVFHQFDREWGILMAGDSTTHCDAMTVSWGGLGTFWNRPAITVYVRQSRLTKEFMDANDTSRCRSSLHGSTTPIRFLALGAARRRQDHSHGPYADPRRRSPAYGESALVFVGRKALVKYLDPESFVDARAHDAGTMAARTTRTTTPCTSPTWRRSFSPNSVAQRPTPPRVPRTQGHPAWRPCAAQKSEPASRVRSAAIRSFEIAHVAVIAYEQCCDHRRAAVDARHVEGLGRMIGRSLTLATAIWSPSVSSSGLHTS